MAKLALLGLRIHVDAYGDAPDRTDPFAGQASSADVQVDLKYATVTMRQGILNADRNLIGILNRHRFAHQMREGNRHPFENRFNGFRNISYVTSYVHSASAIKYAV
jgi:hypothetical protein